MKVSVRIYLLCLQGNLISSDSLYALKWRRGNSKKGKCLAGKVQNSELLFESRHRDNKKREEKDSCIVFESTFKQHDQRVQQKLITFQCYQTCNAASSKQQLVATATYDLGLGLQVCGGTGQWDLCFEQSTSMAKLKSNQPFGVLKFMVCFSIVGISTRPQVPVMAIEPSHSPVKAQEVVQNSGASEKRSPVMKPALPVVPCSVKDAFTSPIFKAAKVPLMRTLQTQTAQTSKLLDSTEVACQTSSEDDVAQLQVRWSQLSTALKDSVDSNCNLQQLCTTLKAEVDAKTANIASLLKQLAQVRTEITEFRQQRGCTCHISPTSVSSLAPSIEVTSHLLITSQGPINLVEDPIDSFFPRGGTPSDSMISSDLPQQPTSTKPEARVGQVSNVAPPVEGNTVLKSPVRNPWKRSSSKAETSEPPPPSKTPLKSPKPCLSGCPCFPVPPESTTFTTPSRSQEGVLLSNHLFRSPSSVVSTCQKYKPTEERISITAVKGGGGGGTGSESGCSSPKMKELMSLAQYLFSE